MEDIYQHLVNDKTHVLYYDQLWFTISFAKPHLSGISVDVYLKELIGYESFRRPKYFTFNKSIYLHRKEGLLSADELLEEIRNVLYRWLQSLPPSKSKCYCTKYHLCNRCRELSVIEYSGRKDPDDYYVKKFISEYGEEDLKNGPSDIYEPRRLRQ